MINYQTARSLPMGLQRNGSIICNGVVFHNDAVRVVNNYAINAVAVSHIIRDQKFAMRIERTVSGQVDTRPINDVGGPYLAIGIEGGLGSRRESVGCKKRQAVAVVENLVALNCDLDRV
jgi:hypothetical protein